MEQASKCSLYRNFKNDLEVEKYLTVLVYPLKSNLVRFRTSNHRLPIELGRYNEIVRKYRLWVFFCINLMILEMNTIICLYVHFSRVVEINIYQISVLEILVF